MALHRDTMARLVAKASRGGAERRGSNTYDWDISGNCSDPVTIELHARADREYGGLVYRGKRKGTPLTVILHCKCRKCPNCRKLRARTWRNKAIYETRIAPRTWFGTITFAPVMQDRLLERARVRNGYAGVDYDRLTANDQFNELHHEAGLEITKYWKRIRENTGIPFRYFLVAEKHMSGKPHYHALVHETIPDGTLRKRVLQSNWTLGFTQFKLVADMRQATYLCKYLNKSSVARVRASLGYGKERPNDIAVPGVKIDPSNQRMFIGGLYL